MTTLEKIAACRASDDQTTHTIYVCGNGETLRDGYCESLDSDYAGQVIDAAMSVVAALDLRRYTRVRIKVESFFPDWHGGRFTQHYSRYGWCAVAKDSPPWVHDLANAIDDAMTTEAQRIGDILDAAD